MTDDLDSDPTNGTNASPNANGSEGKGDSNSSLDAAKLQTTLEALTKKLDEVDQRSKALQGDKDRDVRKTRTEVDELKRKFAEIEKLKKSGLGEDEAFEEQSFRDELHEVKEQLSKFNPTQTQPAGNGEGKAVDVAQVIKNYALDGNDPEVIAQVLGKQFKSELEAENAALKLAYRRANPTPPSIGASTSVVGTSSKAKLSEQDADGKYSELNKLYKNPTVNSSKIKQLKKELTENGYEI